MKLTQAKESGFTLIEILISVILLTILAGAVLSIQFIISQNQVSVFQNYLTVEDSNSVVSIFARELRNAKEADDGSFPLVTLSDQEIIFYSDYDFDGEVERIRYTLTGTSLTKATIEPTDPPISYPVNSESIKVITNYVRNGTNPIFYYYNKDWPQDTINNPLALASRLSDTQLVKIALTLNTKASDPVKDYTIESFIQIRMVKEND